MSRLIVGTYLPGSSILHRLDPRSKLIFSFLFMILVVWVKEASVYLMLMSIVVLGIYLSQISFWLYIKALRPILLLILFTSLLHLLITQEGDVVFRLGWLTIYEEGIWQAILTLMRFSLLLLIACLLTFTTSPLVLMDGLERLLSPLSRLGVPSYELSLMMSIALRFIPTLWEELDRIRKAQLARGANWDQGWIWDRIKGYIPVFIPLLISSFRRADELAMAMEARCYRGGEGRTRFRSLQFSHADYMLLLLIPCLCFFVWWLSN